MFIRDVGTVSSEGRQALNTEQQETIAQNAMLTVGQLLMLTVHMLKETRCKKYLAIARAGVDGHAFAFSEMPDVSMALDPDDDGCVAPCLDIDQFSCGCADAVCRENGAGPAPGEDNARRWIVYEVPQEFLDAAAAKAAGRKKAGGKKKAKR